MPSIVDSVLYFLALLSLLTWTILFYKMYVIFRLSRINQALSAHVGDATSLAHLPQAAQDRHSTLSALHHGFLQKLKRLQRDVSMDADAYAELLGQHLKQMQHQQHTKLESGLAVLASIGSTAPFIGLFGTVWGIMNALKGISETGSAGLDVVAGPIGEALIATAMGIAAAIPAVLAYNFLLRRVRLANVEMSHFSERLLTLAKRADYTVG